MLHIGFESIDNQICWECESVTYIEKCKHQRAQNHTDAQTEIDRTHQQQWQGHKTQQQVVGII